MNHTRSKPQGSGDRGQGTKGRETAEKLGANTQSPLAPRSSPFLLPSATGRPPSVEVLNPVLVAVRPRVVVAMVIMALAAAITQRSTAAETGRSDRVPSGWQRPNIVLVYCDDHAYQAISAYQSLSAYGLKLNQTPHIDRLAREGMRFDNCFVTNSICGPCRAVVQTGKYSHLNGFLCNGDRFDGRQQTFPKLLQKAGYQTAVVGKWHLESDPVGYDYWHVLIGQGPYYNPPMIDNGKRVKHIGYTTEIITDIALDWLKNRRDPNRPFMLMCQHKAPHREWEPGPGYLTMYDDVTIPEPDTLFDDYSGRGTAAKTQDMSIAKTMNDRDLKLVPPPDLTAEQLEPWNRAYEPKNEAFRKANLQGRDLVRWKYQRYMKDYLRCIAAVDDNLGRLLKYLDDTGLAENTVVIYSSDQGFYLGEHGWFDKRWIYQESLRTPLIVRWPGVVKPGSTNQDIVSNLDFAETFLELAGQQVPDDMQGRSLVPLLKGQTPADWRKAFYYHYYEYPAVHSVRRHYGVVCQWPGAGGQEVRMQNAECRMPKSEIPNPKSQTRNLKSEIGNLKSEPPSPEAPAPSPPPPAPGLYKLIHFYPSPWDPKPIDEWELYDLKSDPKELKSVYGDPNYAEVRKRLERELARLRGELKVPAQDPPQTARGLLRKAAAR